MNKVRTYKDESITNSDVSCPSLCLIKHQGILGVSLVAFSLYPSPRPWCELGSSLSPSFFHHWYSLTLTPVASLVRDISGLNYSTEFMILSSEGTTDTSSEGSYQIKVKHTFL